MHLCLMSTSTTNNLPFVCAQIAAMSLPPKAQGAPNSPKKPVALPTPYSPEKSGRGHAEAVLEKPITKPNPRAQPSTHVDNTQGVIEGIERLAVADSQSSEEPSSIPNGQGGTRGGTDSTEDDESQLSRSSTKGPGFDTKSMASVTTFAMDEKESLRPDDSASVQAGDEEENHSPFAGGITSSQRSSDVGAAPVRVQLRDGYNFPSRRPPMGTLLNPPRFGDFPLPSSDETGQAPNEARRPEMAVSGPSPPQAHMLSVVPDEKLLDAMGTPKDRLLLLQLEEKIVAFITQSQ